MKFDEKNTNFHHFSCILFLIRNSGSVILKYGSGSYLDILVAIEKLSYQIDSNSLGIKPYYIK
jgi:hypothetical protein